jgi:phytoene/squalene synthetase
MDPGAARASGENFPVALRLLPTGRRRYLMAVYGFARTADDIGDRAPPAQRKRLLDELEADLRRLYASPGRRGGGAAGGNRGADGGGEGDRDAAGDHGDYAADGEGPKTQVVRALAPAVTDCGIPQQPFLDLIQANRQDQVVSRYQTFDDLQGYCRLSANPVGRIVLHVFGSFSPRRAELSDAICTALQLAEHWQDVAEDLRAGRVYVPAQDLAEFGCTEHDLSQAPALAAIAAADHDVLRGAPRPGKRRLAAELVRAYVRGR